MGLLTDVADGVLDVLSNGTYSMAFTPLRRYAPSVENIELGTLKVLVVPATYVPTPESRNAQNYEIGIDVGVMKQFGSAADGEDFDTPENIDPLIDLVEEIEDSLTRIKITSCNATWNRTERDQLYSSVHMSDKRLFVGITRYTFKVVLDRLGS